METGKGTWEEKRSCWDTSTIPHQLVCFQNKRVSIGKDELKSTSKAVETVHNLCCNENKGASELVAELSTLYQCIR